MADEIQIQTKLYASKGGAVLPAVTNTVTLDMTGADMGTWTQNVQVSGSGEEVLDLPPDITTDYWLEIKSLENETTGSAVSVGNATGGSFAEIFVIPASGVFGPVMVPSGTTVYLKNKSASAVAALYCRACEV